MTSATSVPAVDYEWVADQGRLEQLVERWQGADALAVDTEFVRVHTYYPKPGLIQVASDDGTVLIDPLAIDDLSSLGRLLQAVPVKVLHACSEDVELFSNMLGVPPTPLFDTQVAAALLTDNPAMSYQNLVSWLLDIHLPKDETRSDWRARPLSSAQCSYAALDVHYLLIAYRRLVQRLQDAGRGEWAEQDCRLAAARAAQEIVPDEAWQRVRGANRLDRRQLQVLRALCRWREQTARSRDVPRSRVAGDKSLLALAPGKIGDRNGLRTQADMTPQQIRLYGDEILEVLRQAPHADADLPEPLDRPLNRQESEWLKPLREIAGTRADELGIAHQTLVRRRDLEALIRQGALPAELHGWRASAVGPQLLERLQHLQQRQPGLLPGDK